MAKKYSLILADPPYRYDNQQTNDPKRGGITYSTMTIEEMAKIPIGNCAADNSILVCWTTFPKLTDRKYDMDFFEMIRQWSFTPVTALFVWIKLNKNAGIKPYHTLDFGMSEPYWDEDKVDANHYEHVKCGDLYSGLGRYTNSNAEIAIVCRRGKGLPRIAKNVKQIIFAPIGEHSAKPQVQYKRLSDLYGDDIPCIELFARKQNPPPTTWDATGLDYNNVDIRDWIKQYDTNT